MPLVRTSSSDGNVAYNNPRSARGKEEHRESAKWRAARGLPRRGRRRRRTHRGVGLRIRIEASRSRAGRTSSAGSRRSAGRTASTRPASTSPTRSRSTAACCCGRSSATTTSPARPGNKLVPDLATTVPKPTNGGKTYTFKLKNGIKFGPPVNREITSADVKYALERLARPEERRPVRLLLHRDQGLGRVLDGQDEGDRRDQDAEHQDDRLQPRPRRRVTSPTALSMPATAPIPPEVGKCFEGQPGKYGLDVVSSGPYMIEGSDERRHQLVRRDQADERHQRDRS